MRQGWTLGDVLFHAEDIYRIASPQAHRRTVAYLEKLPASVDRRTYFRALLVAEMRGISQGSLTAEWFRRRDAALANLGAAIEQFKSVVRDVDITGVGNLDYWTGGLEREYRRLTEPWEGYNARHLMVMTLEDAGRKTVGRPVSRAKHARRLLRVAGVPTRSIGGVLLAAGLSEKSPHFARR
jgi:hypothetical protein